MPLRPPTELRPSERCARGAHRPAGAVGLRVDAGEEGEKGERAAASIGNIPCSRGSLFVSLAFSRKTNRGFVRTAAHTTAHSRKVVSAEKRQSKVVAVCGARLPALNLCLFGCLLCLFLLRMNVVPCFFSGGCLPFSLFTTISLCPEDPEAYAALVMHELTSRRDDRVCRCSLCVFCERATAVDCCVSVFSNSDCSRLLAGPSRNRLARLSARKSAKTRSDDPHIISVF